MSRQVLAIAACLTLIAAVAQAQSPGCRHPHCVYRPYAIVSPHHASTAEESILRGWADVMRAQGLYNVMTSQALIHQAEAYRLQVENRVARTEAYFKMRDINRQARFGNHPPGAPKTAAASQPQSRPIVPGPSPLDAAGLTRGLVRWPAALQDERCASYRQVVERLVAKNYQFGGLADEDRSTLTQASRAMAGELRSRIRSCSPQDYVDAKQLLIALAG
jgi:hypothetical protein